jgi:hypothetical protein
MRPEDRDEARRLAARSLLWRLLGHFRNQVDVVIWRAEGGPEAEAFLNAVDTGGTHPYLDRCQELQSTVASNRPAPDPVDVNARCLVVAMVEALHRAGMNKRAARKQAATAVKGVVPEPKGDLVEAIRYWQAIYPITADAEKLIVEVVKRYGNDHRSIVGWFVGQIRFGIDPEAAWTARRVLIQR